MFVREKTHQKTLRELIDTRTELLMLQGKFLALQAEWNSLVRKINAKGGEAFLEGKSKQFNREEIDRLVRLCHPDKHGQSKAAVEMTQKLLSMR